MGTQRLAARGRGALIAEANRPRVRDPAETLALDGVFLSEVSFSVAKQSLLFSWICFPDRGRGYKHYIAYSQSAYRELRGNKLLITAARCDNKSVGFLFRCINNPEATICLRAKAWIAYGNRQAPNNPAHAT